MKDELITVVVPIYNVENYLEKCLESIINQTYTNIEIILVNDGSTDGSGIICDKYKEKDNRIKVIHKTNGGLSDARNKGTAAATGLYITFVDSDDWLDKNMILELYNTIKKYNAKIACCGKISYINEDTFMKFGLKECKLMGVEDIIKLSAFDAHVGIAAWGKLYDKELFNEITFPKGEIHEDVAIMYKLFDKAQKIVVLGNSYYYYYRMNESGISKSVYSEKFDVVLKHDLENELFISDRYKNLNKIMKAITAKSCIDMQLKILKTNNGYIDFQNQYENYNKNLKKRLKCYLQLGNVQFKRLIWIGIILCMNKFSYKLFKIMKIIK